LEQRLFPKGEVIDQIGGLLEEQLNLPPQNFYSLAIRFRSNRVTLLYPNHSVEVPSWPNDTVTIPSYGVDGDHRCVGAEVTNAFIRKSTLGGIFDQCNPQLFLVLDGRGLFGLVQNQMGSMLFFEPLLTSSLLNRGDDLTEMDGKKISLDQLVIL